ncbi:hypothetical protein AB834_03185 [PVC group bacterium (ex Bugula neritina AB1)]|nr:hypothetical protein AB834_03185 [PVC group bacterium (ex Bugula neritina AB1)]
MNHPQKKVSYLFFIFFFLSLQITSTLTSTPLEKKDIYILPASDLKWQSIDPLEWEPLDPSQNKDLPMRAPLWGDFSKKGPSGSIVYLPKGFKSKPHEHNATYRAITISGSIHSAHPSVKDHWLQSGSFWIQPARGIHIAKTRENPCYIYVEIDKGPQLTFSPDIKNKPTTPSLALDFQHLTWLNQKHISWLPSRKKKKIKNLEIAFLWGKITKNDSNGTLLKLPSFFSGKIINKTGDLHIIVIKGKVGSRKFKRQTLSDKSYFYVKKGTSLPIENLLAEESWIYIRSKGKYKVH